LVLPKEESVVSTKTWKCDVCGYVHRGDAPPETCPVCGVGPEMFSPLEVAQPESASEPTTAWRCTICDYVHEGDAPPDVCPLCGAGASLFEPAAGREPDAEPAAGDAGGVRILILGGGIAGVTAAEQARLTSAQAEITVLSGEPGLPYYRLNLTRFLAGEVPEEQLTLQPEAWFAERRIELVQGEATGIDREKSRVELRDGQNLGYDRLVVASGAHSFVPPIPGVTKVGVYSLRTLADAREILGRAKPELRCACLGGGLLGLEVAGALLQRGISPTVLEGFESLLPRQLAPPAGRLLRERLEGLGITVRCGVRVEEILGDETVQSLRLASGEEIPAELVILATGVRPNSYLARMAGLDVNRGVLVNDRMQTSDPSIFAAGDAAEHRGVVYGLWPSSFSQGLVAGANAAGGHLDAQGMPPSNRLKVLDVDLFSIGQFQPQDGSYQLFEEERDGVYTRLVCRDGQLVGANLYGDTALAGSVKTAVEEGTQLAELHQVLERFPGLADLCWQGEGA
jgi:nitrite reductase (NADH) large subunit